MCDQDRNRKPCCRGSIRSFGSTVVVGGEKNLVNLAGDPGFYRILLSARR